MNDNQDTFISTVRQALGKSSQSQAADVFEKRPDDAEQRLTEYKNRSRADRHALLDAFMVQAELAHITATPVKTISQAAEGIQELVHNTAPEWGSEKSVITWNHPLIRQLDLKQRLEPEGIDLFTPSVDGIPDERQRQDHRRQLIRSYIGITSADFCVARSATLVMRTRPGQPRAVSLVPSVHVAVIRLDQVIDDLKELYFRLRWDPDEQKLGLTNCMTFISGPSKTGDIELEMVYGAHGPRQVHIFVVTG